MAVLSFIAFTWKSTLMNYMDIEYPFWIQQKEYILQKGDKQEIIFLGDSACKAGILPWEFGDDAFVLALGGATPIEMEYTLRTYLQNHPKPKQLYMAFSALHYVDHESYRFRNLYFHYFPLKEIFTSQLNIFRLDNVPYPERLELLAEDLQYAFRLPTKYYRTIVDSRLQRGPHNYSLYQKVLHDRGHRLFGTDDYWYKHYQPYEGWLRPCKPRPSIDFYLHRIFALCREQGIPVYLFQVPMHELDYALLEKNGYLKDYLAYFNKLKEEPGITVDAYIPVYTVDHFGDNLHVNDRGARRFTAELKHRLGLP